MHWPRVEAIILAGGRGERLMPLTADRPKCLVELAGQPLIAHQLRWLARQGIKRVVISCGYHWEQIRSFLGSGSTYGLDVTYAPEETPLGRGGGLRKALAKLKTRELVVACNGDTLTSLALRPMIRAHRRSGALATLLLVPYLSQHGIAEVDIQSRIVGFREKPSLPYLLSGGIYVLSPDIERLLPRRGDHEVTLWPRLAAERRLYGYRFLGFWQSVDSAKDLQRAERRLRRVRLAG